MDGETNEGSTGRLRPHGPVAQPEPLRWALSNVHHTYPPCPYLLVDPDDFEEDEARGIRDGLEQTRRVGEDNARTLLGRDDLPELMRADLEERWQAIEFATGSGDRLVEAEAWRQWGFALTRAFVSCDP